MSINGVHAGLRLPEIMLATSVASRPTVCPAASTTYHLRFSASPVPLGKYVDIDNSLWFWRLKRERLEYRNAPKNVKLNGAKSRRAHTTRGSPVNEDGEPLAFSFELAPRCLRLAI